MITDLDLGPGSNTGPPQAEDNSSLTLTKQIDGWDISGDRRLQEEGGTCAGEGEAFTSPWSSHSGAFHIVQEPHFLHITNYQINLLSEIWAVRSQEQDWTSPQRLGEPLKFVRTQEGRPKASVSMRPGWHLWGKWCRPAGKKRVFFLRLLEIGILELSGHKMF